MKKQTAITISILLALLTGAVSVSAQTSAQTDAQAHVGGGLGTGISHMVQSILGDSAAVQSTTTVLLKTAAPVQAPTTPRPKAAAVPQAASLAFKFASTGTLSTQPLTTEDLNVYVHQLLHDDSRLQSVDTADTHVRLTYAVPSKIFGVMPVMVRVTVGTYASGGVDVAYPWYAFAAGLSSDFKARMIDTIQPLHTSASSSAAVSFSPDQQKTYIDLIHMALATEFKSSTGGDK